MFLSDGCPPHSSLVSSHPFSFQPLCFVSDRLLFVSSLSVLSSGHALFLSHPFSFQRFCFVPHRPFSFQRKFPSFPFSTRPFLPKTPLSFQAFPFSVQVMPLWFQVTAFRFSVSASFQITFFCFKVSSLHGLGVEPPSVFTCLFMFKHFLCPQHAVTHTVTCGHLLQRSLAVPCGHLNAASGCK